MQPTLPQSNAGAADMDLPAAQSMDWLFRKERIYLLAQFWQQVNMRPDMGSHSFERATLAEKEVNTLKEQLSNTSITSTHSTTSTSSLSPNTTTVAQAAAAAAAASLLNKLTLSQTQQNGIPNSPPLSMTSSVDLMNPLTQNSKLLNNNNNSNSVNNNNNNSKSNELLEKSETKENPNFNCSNLDEEEEDDEIDEEISKINSSKMDTNSNSNSNNNNKSIKNNNNNSNSSKINNHHLNNDDDNDNNNSGDNNNILDDDDDDDGGNKLNSSTLSSRSSTPAHQQQNNDKENSDSNNINSSNNSNLNNNNNNNSNSLSTRTLAEELAAKDKEISTLVEEVSRLRSAITALQESHQSQLKRLEDRIDAKRQHITRLESRIDNQSEYDDVKKENSILRSVDFSSPQSSDTKQFQELLLERTKALAAQTEAIKSSSSDGTSTTNTTTTTTTNQDCQPQQQQQQQPEQQQQQQYEQPKLTIQNITSNSPSPQPIDIPSSSSSSSIINCVTPSITPVPLPILTGTANGEPAKINLTPQSKLLNQSGPPPSNSTGTSGNLQNVEQFGSFLGEEIVSNWRREITRERNNSYNHHNLRLNQSNNNNIHNNNSHNSNSINNHLNSPLLDGNHSLTHPDNDKSRSSHHDASSRASTPIHMSSGQDGRLSGISEENMHLNGLTALSQMSLNPHHHHSHHHQLQQYHHQLNQHHHQQLHQMSKSPIDDNNQHSGGGLGGPSNTGGSLIPGLPFQFQERGHFRFADDLQMPPGSMVGRLGDSLIPKGDPMEARLQEMLRYNMDKYSNQSLDTLHISRRVRELLSVHNIGQRLFAKYVLGLSQGTVSELLSKPKPWDKLTEKGRDSYRKMHAWGCDDNAVMLLKSLIPKKDKIDSGITQYGGRPENDITDERIQHILGEAANLMKTPSNSGGSINLPMNSQSQPPILQSNLMQTTQSSASTTSSNLSAGGNSSGGNGLNLLSQMPQQPIKTEEIISNDEDSKSPPPNHCDSPFFPLSAKEAMLRNKMKKYDNDDISHEKVTRIYQEELAKLMSRAPPNLLFPHFFSGAAAAAVTNHNQNSNGGNSQNNILPSTSPMPDDNIRLALEAYHRELAKIQAGGANLPNFPNFPNLPGLLALQQHALNGAQDLSLPKEKLMKINGSSQSMMSIDCESSKDMDESQSGRQSGSAFSLVRPKNESTPTTTASSAPSPIGNSILPPAITPTDDLAASPLQRMASITNSLITQPPVTPHHSTPQRPLKAVLPPITQQQFDMFNNLNTEDIVRRVKEALSQYSISQRLFGESVLGLSQGSVSDLLARPKPWHMLTQKGREPFIRMKMFLEDDNAVHKLVASQYKIAPEKLMRTGSYSGSPQIPSAISKAMPMMPKLMGEQLSKMQEEQQHRMLQQLQQGSPMGPHIPSSQPQTMLLTPPGLPPHHAIVLSSQEKAKQQAQAAAAAAAAQQAQQLQQQQAQQAAQQNMPMPIHSPQQQSNNPMRNMNQHMSPTVYEMAALTQDLDTQVITTKIKEALLANNIGQKIFGEAVLGLSQGSVSELLSKPKPWHMLSIKGREPFIRMQLWLADTNNVERLQVLKNERREANKRRRSTGPGAQDNSSDTSSNDTSEFYHSNSPGPASVGSASTGPPNKKQRVLFSEEQKEALRLAFQLDPYPNVATIEFLANELGLSTRTITNWFHNHRMRLKQQVPHGQPSEPVPSRDSVSGHPFDQNQFRALLHQRLMELQKERMGISGVPLPYAPYFAANPNLAALIQRGLIPGGDAASFAALNNAFKQEQMNGLDLSVKRDGDDDFDENDDEDNEDHSRLSDNESIEDSMEHLKNDPSKNLPPTSSTSLAASMARSSRRKPAAPQWVNPVWQDDKILASGGGTNIEGTTNKSNADEVIINGVCIMQQAADFSRLSDQTLRIEPSSFNDNGNDDDDDDDVRDKTAQIIKTEKITTNDRGDDDDDCDEVDDDDDVVASNLNTVNDSNNNNNDSNDDNKSNNNNSAENLVDETAKKIKTELNDTTDADRWDY